MMMSLHFYETLDFNLRQSRSKSGSSAGEKKRFEPPAPTIVIVKQERLKGLGNKFFCFFQEWTK
jgi:hypothetical protein